MECRERARERDGARERERERARARAKPCILASGLGRSTAAQGVGVRVGGWGRGCDFARGRATAGYGPSNLTPARPWTSSDDRRTRSQVSTIGSHPKCAPGGEGVRVRVGGWGRGCDSARGRATAGYAPSNLTPSCPWTCSDDRRIRSQVSTIGSHPKCAPGGGGGCACGWVGAGKQRDTNFRRITVDTTPCIG